MTTRASASGAETQDLEDGDVAVGAALDHDPGEGGHARRADPVHDHDRIDRGAGRHPNDDRRGEGVGEDAEGVGRRTQDIEQVGVAVGGGAGDEPVDGATSERAGVHEVAVDRDEGDRPDPHGELHQAPRAGCHVAGVGDGAGTAAGR